MTPEEAGTEFLSVRCIDLCAILDEQEAKWRLLFNAVAATAKATETRRCAARVRNASEVAFNEHIANDLLTTGGLEVEEPDGKMKP